MLHHMLDHRSQMMQQAGFCLWPVVESIIAVAVQRHLVVRVEMGRHWSSPLPERGLYCNSGESDYSSLGQPDPNFTPRGVSGR